MKNDWRYPVRLISALVFAVALGVLAWLMYESWENAQLNRILASQRPQVDAGIGEDIYGGYDSHMIEDSFSVIAKNAKEEDLDRFYSIIIDTLRAEVEKGFNEKAILAALNIREFRFREADYGGYPRGLDIASDMLQSSSHI